MDKINKLFVTTQLASSYIEKHLIKTVGDVYNKNSEIIQAVNKIIDFVNAVDNLTVVSGKSAYDIAVQYGFDGTVIEWLNSLKAKFSISDFTETDKQYLVDLILDRIGFKLEPVVLTEEQFKQLEDNGGIESNKIYYIGEYYDSSK